MYLKSINNVIGYKNLPDGFNAEFNEGINYITGANFQCKTTVGSLFNWCLTGTTLYGKEKESVENDNTTSKDVMVDITFVDNFGIEHRLVRNKAKEYTLILDGKEIKQENLAQFYKDKDIFLVAHNPYYFYSLQPKEQKDLIRKIVPAIDPLIAFNFLTPEEQQIIEKPIDILETYTDKRNEQINNLKNEYATMLGEFNAYERMALIQEGELLKFEKEQELKELQDKYKEISNNEDIGNIQELQKSIEALSKQINEIINIQLVKLQEQYKIENNKLKSYQEENTICPSCRQKIQNSEAKTHLINFQQKEISKIENKVEELKNETRRLVDKRKEKIETVEKINTGNIADISKLKNELKEKIDKLQTEKLNIELHNKEVETKRMQVLEAKRKIEITKRAMEEIKQQIETNTKQKNIANKLKILIIEKQQNQINQYLNKVSIQFSKINKTNDKIVECCEIQYEGREYKKLSKSQQTRACLEISNVFNNLSGIKAPIFFDDAESTTDIINIDNTQIIISFVIKYNQLEILYDYEDVLDRRKKSINKEIEENNNYLQKVA